MCALVGAGLRAWADSRDAADFRSCNYALRCASWFSTRYLSLIMALLFISMVCLREGLKVYPLRGSFSYVINFCCACAYRILRINNLI